MGNILLYADLRKLVEDIKSHPNGGVIADFIDYWYECYFTALGEGFLFTLLDLINEEEPNSVTEREIASLSFFNIKEFGDKNPQLRFAKAIIEKRLDEEEDLSIVDRQNNNAKTLRFGINTKFRPSIIKIIRELRSTNVSLLSEDVSEELFADILVAEDLRDDYFKDKQIVFGCNTQMASYIIYSICYSFHKKPYGQVFNVLNLFYTQSGEKLKSVNLSKSYNAARRSSFEYKGNIDEVLKRHNPYK